MGVVFLTSMPRAGSTWVSNIIGKSNSVNYVSGEPFRPAYSRVGFGLEIDEWFVRMDVQSEKLRHQLDNALCQKYTGEDFKRRIRWAFSNISNPQLMLRVFKHFYFFLNRRDVFFKDPIGFFSSEFIHSRYNAKVIILVRHPAAVIKSFFRVRWDLDARVLDKHDLDNEVRQKYMEVLSKQYSKNSLNRIKQIEKLALIWNVFYYQAYKWKENYKNWIVIRHEDFSTSPVESFNELFRSLNFEMNPEVEKYIEQTTKNDNPVEVNDNSVHQLKRNSANINEGYKTYFTEEEMNCIFEVTRDVQKLYGYC
jgi:hypothetical protein